MPEPLSERPQSMLIKWSDDLLVVSTQVGYIAFGEMTHDIITFNLPSGWSTPIVKASLCLGLFLTFPPMMIPVYQIIERGLVKKVPCSQGASPLRVWSHFIGCSCAPCRLGSASTQMIRNVLGPCWIRTSVIMPAALRSQLLVMRTADLLALLPDYCGLMVVQSSLAIPGHANSRSAGAAT